MKVVYEVVVFGVVITFCKFDWNIRLKTAEDCLISDKTQVDVTILH